MSRTSAKRALARRSQRFIAISAAVATGLSGLISPAVALDWNPTGLGTAIGGDWDNNATNTNWNGPVAWTPGVTAVFGGTAGTAPYTINLTDTTGTPGPIVASALQFSTDGYVLQQAGVLPTTLSLTANNITVDATVGATINNNVWAPASTQIINKLGTGTLTLTGNSTRSGATNISAGTLSAAVSSSSNPLGTGAISLNAGTLDLTPSANVATNGLTFRRFSSNVPDTARIDFTGTALSTGVSATVNAAPPALEANQWTGKLSITTGGSYTFRAAADDGMRLFINGVLVVQNDGGKGTSNGDSAPITLSAGLHDVRIDYVNSGGGGGAIFSYAGPDQVTMGVVPTTALRTAETASVTGASNAVVIGTGVGNTLNVAGASKINLNGGAFTQVQLGDSTFAAGSSLELATSAGQIGKSLRLAGNAVFATGTTTLNLAGDGTNGANLYFDGIVSDGGSPVIINKTGNGRLYFTNTSTPNTIGSSSVVDVQAGTLHLVGSSAAGSTSPLGSATIALSGVGSTLVLDSKVGSTTTPTNFGNSLNVTENATVQSIISGGSIASLNGGVNVAAGKTLTLDAIRGGNPVASLGANLYLNGTLSGSGNLNIVSTGIGTLPITPVSGIVALGGSNGGYTGTATVGTGGHLAFVNTGSAVTTTLAGGTLSFLLDGNGTGQIETLATGANLTLTAASTVSVNRLGLANFPLFTTPANKLVQISTLTLGGNNLTVTNTNNYALAVSGATTLTGSEAITVSNATGTNLNQGLTLNGVVTAPSGILKRGGGALLLTNAGNAATLTGTLAAQAGAIAATSDTALGAPANNITLGVNSTVNGDTVNASTTVTVASTAALFPGMAVSGTGIPGGATIAAITGPTTYTLSAAATANGTGVALTYQSAGSFAAIASFTTNRTFTFNHPTTGSNLINVAPGQTFEIASALTGANGFQKSDQGVLLLSNGASSITGPITASGGVLRITNSTALGVTSALTVSGNEGTAFQLDGSGGAINFNRPITIGATTGIENNGGIQNFAGSNSISSAITLAGAATIGNSAAGTTLSVSGGVTGAFALTLNGVGDVNIDTTALGAITSLTRNGSGTSSLTVASPLFVGAIGVNGSTLTLSGAGTVGTGAVATTVTSGGTFRLDNSGTATTGRLATTRTMNLVNGTFQFIGGPAAGTLAESMGTLTSTWGGNTIRIDPGSTDNTITYASLAGNAVNGGSTLVFQSGATGSSSTFGATNSRVVFTTAPTLTNGLIQRAVVFDNTGGSPSYNFATHVAVTGIAAFSAYNVTNNLNAAANTDTMRLTASPANLTLNRTLNALAFNGAVTADGSGLRTLTLTSGNILVQAGTATIGSNLVVAAGGTEIALQVAPGATLNVNAPLTNSNNLTVGLGGTLNFNTRQYFNTGGNSLTINGSTVKLGGGDNTLFPGQTTGANQNMAIGPAGTLDLNGSVQVVGDLRNPNNNAIGGAGGSVVNTSASPATLVIRQPNANWAGVISGNITYVMGNTTFANVERFYENNTYTGRTGIVGGTLELTDSGRLSATSAIDIQYGQLNIDNTSGDNGRFNLADRVNNSTPITIRGGFLAFQGRAQSTSTESVGVVTLAQGVSNLTVNSGGTGIHNATLTLADLTRSSNDATMNLNGAAGQIGSGAKLIITPRETTPGLTNNIVGGWAVNGGADFVSYIPGLGLAALNANGYAGYDGATITLSTNASQNIKTTAAAALPAGGANLNSLVMGGNVTFSAGTDVMNVTSGGILKNAGAALSIGATADSGRVTAGGTGAVGTQQLYVYNNAAAANTLTINSRIVDNGAAPVRLVTTLFNGGVVVLGANTNSYTGGTVVNGWVNSPGGLTIGATGNLPAGGLTINNGNVTQTAGGVIAPQPVEMNGGASLTLAGNNTLDSLTINNNGGSATPTVTTGGTLSLTGSITATSNSVSTLPVINGAVDFGGTPRTLNISPIQYNGVTLTNLQPTLNIAAAIQNAGQLTVDGGGRLQLSGQSTFTGGVLVKANSGVVIGANSTPINSTVVSGPLGTGTMTLESGATLLSSGAFTVANDIVLQGNLNFAGINNLTFTGNTTLPLSALTIDVNAPQQTVSLIGTFTNGSTPITKTGYGTLVLGAGYTGGVVSGGGTLALLDDGDGLGTPNSITYGSAITATGPLALTLGRTQVSFSPYRQSASNKTIQVATLSLSGNDLTVTNNNDYGLNVTGALALPNDQVINVVNPTTSNYVAGLTLSGVVSGTGGIIKQGGGTVVLANGGNTFGGVGKLVDIQNGIVSVGSDAALGDANNAVRIGAPAILALPGATSGTNTRTVTVTSTAGMSIGQPIIGTNIPANSYVSRIVSATQFEINQNIGGTATSGTLDTFSGRGFRATGTFATSRVFQLDATSNGFEVTEGNVFTINTPFTLGAVSNSLVKFDAGVLNINAANPTWSGGVIINQGAVRVSDAGALGTGTVQIAPRSSQVGAALQLNGVSISNAVTLQAINNQTLGGLDFGGHVQAVGGGASTTTGALTTAFDASLGANTGSTLNIDGSGLNVTAARQIFFNANGTINLNSAITAAAGVFALQKYGAGTMNVTAAQAANITDATGIRVNAGTLSLSGAGTFTGGTAQALTVFPNAAVSIDNTSTNSASRFGARPVVLIAGDFNYTGNAANASDTLGALTIGSTTLGAGGMSAVSSTPVGAGTNTLTFASLTMNGDAGVTFSGAGLGTAANRIIFTAAPTTTNNVIQRAFADAGSGVQFATHGANGIAPIAPTVLADINTAGTTANIEVNASQTTTAGATRQINTLRINGAGVAINGGASTPAVPTTLNLQIGGIISTGGNNSINVPVVNYNGFQANIFVDTGTTLTFTSTPTNSSGWFKSGTGTLVANVPDDLTGIANLRATAHNSGNVVVADGTLQMGAANNTFNPGVFLRVAPGATLDTNGSSQLFRAILSDVGRTGFDPGTTLGQIVNTGGTQSTIVMNHDGTDRNMAMRISGNIALVRSGPNTSNIFSDNTYTGPTVINGGQVQLLDYGKLSGTSAIEVNNATLTLSNNGAATVTGRLNPSAPVTLNAGRLNLNGRPGDSITETMGSLVIGNGYNMVIVTGTNSGVIGGTYGVGSTRLVASSLARTAGSTGVVRLDQAGAYGLNGSNPQLDFTTAPTLSNNIIGAWAIVDREWMSYIPGLGAGSLQQTGFYGSSPTAITGTPLVTDNVRTINISPTLTGSGTLTVNTLNFQWTASQTLNLGGRTLNVAAGGLIMGTGSDNVSGTISNGSITSGLAGGIVGTNDLYVNVLPFGGNNRQAVISGVIADNGATPVRAILTSTEGVASANRLTLTGVNTYTGGTVIQGGTVLIGAGGSLPGGSIVLNSGMLDQQIGGQVSPGTISVTSAFTLNGPSNVSLVNDNTIASLAFNNTGSTATPVFNTFKAGLGTDGKGTLTVSSGNITATSSNPATISTIVGRLNTGTGLNINVAPVTINGVAGIAPLTPSLAIQGLVGSGTITKSGAGVLALNVQQTFTGQLNVTNGGVSIGVVSNTGLAGTLQGGSRFANFNLAAGTFLNMADTDATIGSISGAGNVINVSASGTGANVGARTFNVGSDNSSTTFSGAFARASDGFLNPFQVNKIGTGTMTLTGQSTTTNTLQVSQGGVTFSGVGTGVFASNLVLTGGTLTLDNTTTNVNHRLSGGAGIGTINLQIAGGAVTIKGNAAAATTEAVSSLNFTPLTNSNGYATLTLEPNAAQALTLQVLTGGTFNGHNVGAMGVIRGVSATSGTGLGNINIGAIVLGSPTGAGAGANGTFVMPIRPDLLGDASPTGVGTAFLTKDSASSNLRPLTAGEQAPVANVYTAGGTNPTVNFGLSGNATVVGGQYGSVALNSGGGLSAPSSLLPTAAEGGLPINPQVVSGGILAQAGNTGINASRMQTANNTPFYIHTLGNLTVDSVLNGTTGGLAKGGAGTLTLNNKAVYTGNTNIHAGTVVAAGGVNTIPSIYGAAANTSNVSVTGSGTLDLNGNNQFAQVLFTNSNARYNGQGGTVTNTSGTTATFTSLGNSGQTFGGTIAGNLNFTKTGNQLFTLTGPNTYTGVTTVRANTLALADAGSLLNTSAINVNSAGINIDQSGITATANPTRISNTTPVNLQSGTITLTPGGSADSTQTLGTVTIVNGHSTISVLQAPVSGFGALTITNLNTNSNPDAVVNLTGGAGGFFSNNPGLNQSQLFLTNLNGAAIPATITGKILGGNLIANNGEFVTYVQSGTTGSGGINWGVITMNGTTGPAGTIVQNQYDATAITAAGTATTNVRTTASGTLVAGGTTYNSLAVRPAGTAAAITLTYTAATDVLNINSGGISFTNSIASFFGAAADGGRLTAGGTQSSGLARLYFYSGGANHTLHARVVDNPAGAQARLVATAVGNVLTLTAPNTHTGGTVFNGGGGTFSLGGGAGVVVIPAPTGGGTAFPGVTLNNASVTMTTNAGQIAATNSVQLNNGSTLTLVGSNTLDSVAFNNQGGTTTPTVATATNLILTNTNAVTSVNDNPLINPTISGTLLTLPAGANINASGLAPTSLVISAPIASAGAINKTGSGSLLLSGASTFAGGVNLNAGAIILGAASTGTPPTLTNGPLGTGTLAMADGTSLISDGTLRNVGNAVNIDGNVTFGSTAAIANQSTVAGNGVTLSGAVSLGAATRTINVNSFLNVTTMSGVVSGAPGTGLTKTGPGTLALTAANTFDGTVTINAGTLSASLAGSLGTGVGAGNIVFGGGILQHGGTNTTDYSSRFSTAANQAFNIDTVANTVTYATALTSSGAGSSLAKFGSGTLVLTADASYAGDTVIAGGILQLGATANPGSATGKLPTATNIHNGGTLRVNKSTDDTLSGVISGAGALVKLGTGNLTLSGVNTFGGNVTISAATPVTSGRITITNSSALGVGPKTVTIVSNFGPNDGTLALDGSGGDIALASNISFSTSSANGTGGILNVAGNNTIAGNFTLTAGGGSTKFTSNGGNLTLLAGATLTPNTTGRFVILSGTSTGTVAAVMQDGSVTNTLGLTKEGTGTWTLTGQNTYTVSTAINGGFLNVGSAENAGVSGPLGNELATAAGSITFGGGTLQYSAANQFDYSGRFSTGASQPISIDTNGQNVSFATALVSAGGTLAKLGAGTLTLAGTTANTYTGVTTVTGGVLDLNKSVGTNAIVGDGANSKVTADVLVNGGTLRLLANDQLDNTTFVNMTSGAFNLNGKTDTIYYFVNSGGTYTSGRGGGLTVVDPLWAGGFNQIYGNDIYGGTTEPALEISGGTNVIHGDEGTGLGAGSLTVGTPTSGMIFSGATPNLTVSGDRFVAGKLTLLGQLTVNAGTAATITGGPALLSDGVTVDPNQTGLIAGKVDLGAADRTFNVGAGGSLGISAVLQSTGGGLVKTGPGSLTLTAANTYSGGTTVTGGAVTATLPLTSSVGPMSITNAGSSLTAPSIAPSSLTIGAGASAKLTNIDYVGSFAGRSTAGTLANTGLLDVNTTGIVIASAVEADVRAQIISGRNAGVWTGTTGITSSAAIADPANRAVGYNVSGATITVAQTIPGDSNLDGIVNVLDRGTYLANVGQSPRNWQQADWNYDDIVNVLDRAIYLGHVGMSLPTPPPFGAGGGSAGDALGAMSGSGSGTPMLDGPVGGNTTPGDGVPAVTYDPTTGKLMLDTDGLSNINAIFLPVSPQSRFVTVVGDIDGAAGANWSQFYAGGQNWESALFTPAGNLTMGTWELATMQTGLSTSVFSGGIQFILQNGNLVNTTVEVVPEPTGLALAAMAGLGLLARRRRKH